MKYERHSDRDKRIESALLIIRSIKDLPLYRAHKKELLNLAIWKITEADGKYKTRYRTIGALNIKNPKLLNHEHVYQRATLVKRIMNENLSDKDILSFCIGCVVTREEHRVLTDIDRKHDIDGWERYELANIKVYDLYNPQES